ncbi:MAG: hypothetical protein GKR95_17645 [Gammaproteobacteria bacterium]|nr:hypothetical protein [Gammaproteobacteria bacterium]
MYLTIYDAVELRYMTSLIQTNMQFDGSLVVDRNFAQGNTDRHRSIVVESKA